MKTYIVCVWSVLHAVLCSSVSMCVLHVYLNTCVCALFYPKYSSKATQTGKRLKIFQNHKFLSRNLYKEIFVSYFIPYIKSGGTKKCPRSRLFLK